MRIFLVTYYYPPDPAVGAIRPWRVARALAAAGHEVHVVTAATEGKPHPGTRESSGPTIWPVRLQPNLRELTLRARNFFRRESTGTPDLRSATPYSTESAAHRPGTVPAWKRYLYSLMWLPDDRQGFIWPAYRALEALAPTPRDVLYTTGPPFSSHLPALLTRLRYGCHLVMEYRDPWSGNAAKPWWVRSRWTDAVDRRLESFCQSRCSLVVTVSESLRQRVLGNKALAPERVITVLSGIENYLTPKTPDRAAPPFRILHTGTLYFGRDPRPFLLGLASLVRADHLGPETIQVEFVGNCRVYAGASMAEVTEQMGLREIVRLEDWIPQSDIAKRMAEADALLLLAQDQPEQIPNKLYDYLGARRPILAFADASGETACMLRQLKGNIVLAEHEWEPAAVAAALKTLMARTRNPAPAPGEDEEILSAWSSERQLAVLVRHIEALDAGTSVSP